MDTWYKADLVTVRAAPCSTQILLHLLPLHLTVIPATLQAAHIAGCTPMGNGKNKCVAVPVFVRGGLQLSSFTSMIIPITTL